MTPTQMLAVVTRALGAHVVTQSVLEGIHPWFGVPAEHAGAQRVERAEPQPLGRLAQNSGDPLTHLARRPVGEGDGQDLVRKGAFGQQDMREPGRQHAGLAGAGAGEHQQRPVHAFHRGTLFRVQAIEIARHGDKGP